MLTRGKMGFYLVFLRNLVGVSFVESEPFKQLALDIDHACSSMKVSNAYHEHLQTPGGISLLH